MSATRVQLLAMVLVGVVLPGYLLGLCLSDLLAAQSLATEGKRAFGTVTRVEGRYQVRFRDGAGHAHTFWQASDAAVAGASSTSASSIGGSTVVTVVYRAGDERNARIYARATFRDRYIEAAVGPVVLLLIGGAMSLLLLRRSRRRRPSD